MHARTSLIIFLCILFTGAAPMLQAAPSGPDTLGGKTYSLQECVKLALARNSTLIRSANEVERSATYKTQAVGQFIPDLSASASWSRSDQDSYGVRGGSFYSSRNSYSYSVRSGLVLFDGMRNFNGVDQSINTLRASEQGNERSRQNIVFTVRQLFYNSLRLEQLRKVSESNLERSTKQLDRVREFNTVGSVPLADVYRQQSQVGRDELALQQTSTDHENSIVDLQTMIGADPRERLIPDATAIPSTITPADMDSYRNSLNQYDAMITEALERRADYRQAEYTLNASENSKAMAFSGHLPTLSAFAQYSWQNLEPKDFALYDRFAYGLNLSIPILQNFQVLTSVQRAEIDRRNAEETITELRRTIAGDIRKAWNALLSAEKSVEISRRNLVSAEEDQRIANERYSIGAGTLLDLIIANTGLTAAQSDIVNANFYYLISREQLEYELGRISF